MATGHQTGPYDSTPSRSDARAYCADPVHDKQAASLTASRCRPVRCERAASSCDRRFAVFAEQIAQCLAHKFLAPGAGLGGHDVELRLRLLAHREGDEFLPARVRATGLLPSPAGRTGSGDAAGPSPVSSASSIFRRNMAAVTDGRLLMARPHSMKLCQHSCMQILNQAIMLLGSHANSLRERRMRFGVEPWLSRRRPFASLRQPLHLCPDFRLGAPQLVKLL